MTSEPRDADKGQKNSKVNHTLLKRNLIDLWLNEMAESEISIEEAEKRLKSLYSEFGEFLITVLIKRLEDRNVRIRSTAAWALGVVGDEKTIVPLRKILYDPRKSDFAKAAAITGLHELGEDVDLSGVILKNPESVLKDLVEHFLVMLDDDAYTDMLFNEFFSFPTPLQVWFIKELATFPEKKVANFLASIVEDEYVDIEVREEAELSEDALCESGILPDELLPRLGLTVPYRAWSSQSRDRGKVSLFIGWENPSGSLKVLAFFLDFVGGGLIDFFVIYDINRDELKEELLANFIDEEGGVGGSFVEISVDEALYLLRSAFHNKVEAFYPIEFRRYSKIIDDDIHLTEAEASDLTCKLVEGLYIPGRTIEVFCRARANFDFGLAYDLISKRQTKLSFSSRDEFILKYEDDWMEKGDITAFSIGTTEEMVDTLYPAMTLNASIIYIGDGIVNLNKEKFILREEGGFWKILDRQEISSMPINDHEVVSLLVKSDDYGNLYSAIYEVADEPGAIRSKLEASPRVKAIEDKDHLSFRFEVPTNGLVYGGRRMRSGIVSDGRLHLFSWTAEDLNDIKGLMDELLGPSLNMLTMDHFIFLDDNEMDGDFFPPELDIEVAKRTVINDWLITPMPALDGLAPIEALKEPEKGEKLYRLLRQALIYQDLLEQRGFTPLIDYRELLLLLGL